ncbi:MAG TPA: hypothetical protein VIH42_08760 [Thermoguttaceae bacterium]
MEGVISIFISITALFISAVTAWFTLLRRGTIRMTQPTVIYFGPDGSSRDDSKPPLKVFLRTLLYATSKRGLIVERMFVRLRRGESSQTFNIWVYGESSLARGSGIFVGENGVVCNHHFLLPADCTTFEFSVGEYILDVFAKLTGSDHSLNLYTVNLTINDMIAEQLKDPENGLYFDWGPDSQRYHPHIRALSKQDLPPFLKAFVD